MPAVFQPGMRVTAARLNAATPQPWTPWTPDWDTTSGLNLPAFGGDEQIDCRYTVAGKKVDFFLNITFTAATNFGGGSGGDNWRFSLPDEYPAVGSGVPLGQASFFVGSTTAAVTGLAHLHTTTQMLFYIGSGSADGAAVSGGIVDSAAPSIWAAGHRISATGSYEIA